MSRVSFDFDDTLLLTVPDEDWGSVEAGPNEPLVAALREHAANGDEVLIVTSRREKWEREPDGGPMRTAVADFVRAHGLPVTAIHFTNGEPKAPTLIALGVLKHFDDDSEELVLLAGTGIEGVQVAIHPAWDQSPRGESTEDALVLEPVKGET